MRRPLPALVLAAFAAAIATRVRTGGRRGRARARSARRASRDPGRCAGERPLAVSAPRRVDRPERSALRAPLAAREPGAARALLRHVRLDLPDDRPRPEEGGGAATRGGSAPHALRARHDRPGRRHAGAPPGLRERRTSSTSRAGRSLNGAPEQVRVLANVIGVQVPAHGDGPVQPHHPHHRARPARARWSITPTVSSARSSRSRPASLRSWPRRTRRGGSRPDPPRPGRRRRQAGGPHLERVRRRAARPPGGLPFPALSLRRRPRTAAPGRTGCSAARGARPRASGAVPPARAPCRCPPRRPPP